LVLFLGAKISKYKQSSVPEIFSEESWAEPPKDEVFCIQKLSSLGIIFISELIISLGAFHLSSPTGG